MYASVGLNIKGGSAFVSAATLHNQGTFSIPMMFFWVWASLMRASNAVLAFTQVPDRHRPKAGVPVAQQVNRFVARRIRKVT